MSANPYIHTKTLEFLHFKLHITNSDGSVASVSINDKPLSSDSSLFIARLYDLDSIGDPIPSSSKTYSLALDGSLYFLEASELNRFKSSFPFQFLSGSKA